MMFSTRVPPTLTVGKLIAEYYWPQHIADDLSLKKWPRKSLEELRNQTAPIAYGVLKPDDLGDSYRVAKFENFDGTFVRACDCDPISEEMFAEFARSQAIEGDILIAIGGYVGRPAIVQPITTNMRLNINRHLARFRADNSKIDRYYALAYLSSSIGERQLKRQVTGSVQAGINLEDLRLVPIPILDTEVQRFIGSMLRQAEQLRQAALSVIHAVESLHKSLIPCQKNLDFGKRTRAVSSKEMTERFDPHFYPAVVADYFKSTSFESIPLDRVTLAVCAGVTRDETSSKNWALQATVANLSNRFPDGEFRRVTPPVQNSFSFQCHDLALCNAAHNKDYIGREITYCDEMSVGVIPSTEVMTIRTDRSVLPASYVRAYLLTRLGYVQIQSTIRGITAHSYPSDIKRLLIPLPKVSANVQEFFASSDGFMLQAGRYERMADSLVMSAKILVAAVVEGVLDPVLLKRAELLRAEKNDSLVREILGRLYEGGLDATETRPLFPEVETYYETLRSAAKPLVIGGDE
jgi:type I restriction enzyme S subunit